MCMVNVLQWHHNECYGISNHWHLDCSLSCLFRCTSREHQSSASLAFVKGIHWWAVNSPQKGPVTQKMLLFDDYPTLAHYNDVIMTTMASQITSLTVNRLFRRRSKKTSKLHVTGLCAGNSPGPVNSPHKGPVTRKMLPFDDYPTLAREFQGFRVWGKFVFRMLELTATPNKLANQVKVGHALAQSRNGQSHGPERAHQNNELSQRLSRPNRWLLRQFSDD